MNRNQGMVRPAATFVLLALLSGAFAQTQVAPETRPVGDIPDSQAFVRYVSGPGGYSLEIPEGWARRDQGAAVSFTSRYGTIELTARRAAGPPGIAAVRAGDLAALARTDPSVKVTLVKATRLPAGNAVLARFTSTSAPNAVTGRRALLDNDLYVLTRNGREVRLRMSAPRGADNVDAWNRVARSFVWR
jgi:hypothetical protein